MKVAVIFIFAALFSTTASAQSIKYPKMHFGIRVGGSFNTVSTSANLRGFDGDYNFKGKTFPTGGLALDFRIASVPIYLETGAYYVNRSAVIETDYEKDMDAHTIQVPLLLSYHHYISDKTAIQPFIGGYASYLEDFGAGVRLGVGINYGRLYANVGYDIDLIEHTGSLNYSYSSIDFKSPGLFATIGFNFGGSR